MLFRTILIFQIATGLIASAGSLSLHTDAAVERALKNHPTLTTARFRIDEAQGRLRQSGRLSNPELELEASRNMRTPEHTYGAGIIQPLPLSNRLRLEKTIARSDVTLAEAELRDAERRIAAEVRSNCIRLIALQKLQELRKEQFVTNDGLAQTLKKRAQAGEISATEAAQITLENTQLRLASSQLEVEKLSLLRELRLLLGLAHGDALHIVGDLASPTVPARAAIQPAMRGDIQAARILSHSARDAVRLSMAERWGDAGVGIFAEQGRTEDAPDGLESERLVGLRLTLPLPLWNRNEGKLQETRAAARRVDHELQTLMQRAQNEADSANQEMEALARVIREMDQELLPQSQALEKMQQDAYNQGLGPLTETVRARQNRQSLQAQRLEILRDYHLARVRYLAATGSQPKL